MVGNRAGIHEADRGIGDQGLGRLGKKKEAGTLELYKWTGKAPAGFERVERVGR